MRAQDRSTLPARLEAAARTHPDRVAVMCKGDRLTYRQLSDRARVIAEELRRRGVAPGTLVGLHMTRSANMVAAMMAIHRAGGAYVPLDPRYPRERLAYIVRDSGLEHLLHDGTLDLGTPPRHGIELGREFFAAHPAPSPRVESWPCDDDPAYVMYTSGSTGRPKGVKVPQRAVVNFLESMEVEPGLRADDVLLAVTTVCFDISVLEIFLPLLVGATIVLATTDETIDGRQLAALIDTHDVSVMQATPATWRMLFMAGWQGSRKLTALCGGEALDHTLAARLCAATKSVWNMYGPTETTVWSTCGRITDADAPISVGRPIRNTTVHILDDRLQPLPAGEVGEVYIGGMGVALGYTDESLTASRFIADPFSGETAARLYRTGDLGRREAEGTLTVIGRTDDQVKVKGARIELGEVQNAILHCEGVAHAAVVCAKDAVGENTLIAFVVAKDGAAIDQPAVRHELAARLPEYMIPAIVNVLPSMPLTPNGKVDKHALLRLAQPEERPDARASAADLEGWLTNLVQSLVGTAAVHCDDNLFDLGIDSLQANYIAASFADGPGLRVSVAEVFQNPTISSLVAHLENRRQIRAAVDRVRARVTTRESPHRPPAVAADAIAVIGMSGRFPGADTVEALWDVLAAGRDTVTRFSRDEDDPAVDYEIASAPNYVRARGMIANPALFDATFFGISPNDAAVMDPQQRVFLEVAWEAFENAGYDPDRFDGLIGVYAGMGNNFYYYYNVSTEPRLIKMVGDVQVEIGREKDHIATLVSHKLNLTGPSLSVHTACSTGLVAIDIACHSLRSHQCDMALAGAIELRTPQMSGQLHEPDGIFTRDGRCRPFSDDASGTMFSDGAGAVVLRRLDEAIRDGDHIRAVILGSAVNHDGLHKKSYLAPSVRAQMDVIATAHARAGVRPESITYVEAHGTATPVGDPIEFEALRNVFEADTDRKTYCAIGSVKANLGHPTTAAGVVGLIKACLCLEHKQIPPLINFGRINPNIDIENSSFFINAELIEWPAGATRRRGAVSSFGFCGTNAHAVLEEAPPRAATREGAARPYEPLLVSAATESALHVATDRLVGHLAADGAPAVTDAAYTLAVGRKRLRHRRALVAGTAAQAGLDAGGQHPTARRVSATGRPPSVDFVFPGQGAQYAGMGRGLYASEPRFRESLDRCAESLTKELGEDIRDVMMRAEPEPGRGAPSEPRMHLTSLTQPAMFCLGYSLAQLWMSWGVRPHLLLGHSVGEFVCAALAGVFSLDDALRLIAARGRLMNELPSGGMLSVRLPHAVLAPELGPELSIAAINSPNLCVVSGAEGAIDALQASLENRGIRCQRLHTSHAFHSPMMDAAVPSFLAMVRTVDLGAPRIPIISTVTGRPLTSEEARDPMYWARHLRVTVRFADAVSTLWEMSDGVLLELGPRGTMASLAMAQLKRPGRQVAIPTLADSCEDGLESASIARAVGRLWEHHVELDWAAYFAGRPGGRVPLPTTPFERKRHWVDPAYRRGDGPTRPAQPDRPATPSAKSTARVPSQRAATDDGAESRRALMEELRAILESVSGETLPEAPADTTFLELGFDSLLLTPIAFMLRERFGVALTFRQLLREITTLDTLADYLIRAGGAHPGGDPPASPATPAPDSAIAVPPGVLDRITSGDPLALGYLESASIELIGALDPEVLRRAIGIVLNRHPSLHARYTSDGRRVGAGADVPVRILDGQQSPPAEIEEREMREPFQLTEGPLARFTIAHVRDTTHVVLVTADSAVCDAWSMDVVIEELARTYSALAQGVPLTLPAAHDLADYARARNALAAPAADYWSWQFDDSVSAVPRPGGPAAETALEAIDLPAGLMAQLRAACSLAGSSPFTALLAALIAVARRHSDGDDITVAVPVAGQATANLPHLVGPCANTLPIRVRMRGDEPFARLLDRVRDTLLEAYQHQFDAPDARSLCPITLAHTKRLKPEAYHFHGLTADYRFNRKRHGAFDLAFDALEDGDRLRLACSFRSPLYASSTVRRWLEEITSLLATHAGADGA